MPQISCQQLMKMPIWSRCANQNQILSGGKANRYFTNKEGTILVKRAGIINGRDFTASFDAKGNLIKSIESEKTYGYKKVKDSVNYVKKAIIKFSKPQTLPSGEQFTEIHQLGKVAENRKTLDVVKHYSKPRIVDTSDRKALNTHVASKTTSSMFPTTLSASDVTRYTENYFNTKTTKQVILELFDPVMQYVYKK